MSKSDLPTPSSLLHSDALNLFRSLVCAVSYGVAFTLYGMCTRSLVRRLGKPGQRKITLITLTYTTFAIACGSAYLGLTHYMNQMSYVFHRDFPGGPSVYQAVVLVNQPPFLAFVILMAIVDWLTLGVQVSSS
jgi:hypothetical protein